MVRDHEQGPQFSLGLHSWLRNYSKLSFWKTQPQTLFHGCQVVLWVVLHKRMNIKCTKRMDLSPINFPVYHSRRVNVLAPITTPSHKFTYLKPKIRAVLRVILTDNHPILKWRSELLLATELALTYKHQPHKECLMHPQVPYRWGMGTTCNGLPQVIPATLIFLLKKLM